MAGAEAEAAHILTIFEQRIVRARDGQTSDSGTAVYVVRLTEARSRYNGLIYISVRSSEDRRRAVAV